MSTGTDAPGMALEELALVDAIVERLIPSDENGPGAAEARVGRYIARALETEYAASRAAYHAGLAAIDAAARDKHGRGFGELGADAQDAILKRAENATVSPGTGPTEHFFGLIRQHAIEGMFGDPRWGGNHDQIGWKLLGYAGPKTEWTAAEQQIEELPAREAGDADGS